MRLKINGSEYNFEKPVTLLELAKQFQKDYPYDILLGRINGKLQELHKTVKEDGEVEFLTAEQKPAADAYRRSTLFLMLKAFYDVVGKEFIEKINVDFSIGSGLYIEGKGDFLLTDELLNAVKEKMKEFVATKLPIEKRQVSTDEAIRLFHKHGMYDKARLFHYRMSSQVNIYRIGEFEDYYYGYMLENTEYIKYFHLEKYHSGFLLMLPEYGKPTSVGVIPRRDKLFHVLKESSKWYDMLNIPSVGALNDVISKGKLSELVLIQEALQEKKIAEIAEQITMHQDKKLVMIAGPSSSGKTTFSHRLSVQLKAKGLNPYPIAVDNYFVNRVNTPKDEKGEYDFESLYSIDIESFNRDMSDLLEGRKIQLPHYDFITGERIYRGDELQLQSNDILVIEGIHCLNDALSYTLPKESKYKIYISALTQLNIDEHNRIPTTDGRILRRMVRDARTRGATAQRTIQMWPSVKRGEERNIFPFQESADVMFNSALVYELAILKQYAEPLLFGIPRDSMEYEEAKRLLKFLSYFLGTSSEGIPYNSIIREFIGGSCLKV